MAFLRLEAVLNAKRLILMYHEKMENKSMVLLKHEKFYSRTTSPRRWCAMKISKMLPNCNYINPDKAAYTVYRYVIWKILTAMCCSSLFV